MTRASESGFPIRPVYGPQDLPADLADRLGEPGAFPYTRGVYPSMYTGRPWTMRQYAGFGTARESNERYRHLVAQGTGGLSVAFDLPTQMGYDSDHARSEGEVGKVTSLTATSRPSTSSRARQTVTIPPAPSRDSSV